MNYKILKTNLKDISINSEEWNKASEGKISHVQWSDYSYCPDTTVRVLKGEEGLFVKFVTNEENLICDFKNLNDDVYKESCVEFFFKPDPDDERYFNFEMNAAGTPLIGFGKGRAPARFRIGDIDLSIFKIETNILEKGFEIKYFIPFDFILKYVEKIGDYFLGNFQKCKELGNNPHFVTYYPIKTEKPDFHRPEFFEKILIEE